MDIEAFFIPDTDDGLVFFNGFRFVKSQFDTVCLLRNFDTKRTNDFCLCNSKLTNWIY